MRPLSMLIPSLAAASLLLAACPKSETVKDDPPPKAETEPPPEEAKPADDKPPEPVGPDIQTKEITYTGGGVTMKGFMAWDANVEGKRPGVLIVHEWWGHTDYVRERAKMLAAMGYTAFAMDMYGDGKTAAHPKDAGKFAQAVMKDMKKAKDRFLAALEVLKNHETVNPQDVAAIGYCFGGGIVLHMARMGVDLDAVVSFHGSLASKKRARKGQVKAHVLVLHGAADPLVKPKDVKAFKDEMKRADADMEFVVYEGAKHAFTNPKADEYAKKFKFDALGYDKAADEASWAKMTTFLREAFADEDAAPAAEGGAGQ